MTISEMAQKTGLSIHTLRYYEREGLLLAVSRDDAGRRRYALSDLEWLLWIKRLKSTGMPIKSIKAFAELRKQGDSSMAQRREMLQTHAEQLRRDIAFLNRELGVVEYKIAAYRDKEKVLDLE